MKIKNESPLARAQIMRAYPTGTELGFTPLHPAETNQDRDVELHWLRVQVRILNIELKNEKHERHCAANKNRHLEELLQDARCAIARYRANDGGI